MRFVVTGIFVLFLTLGSGAQRPAAKTTPKPKQPAARPKPTATPVPTPEATPTPDPTVVEGQLFESAHAAVSLTERVSLLEKFITDFPNSDRISEARESLLIARAALADEKLDSGDLIGGVELFKTTIIDSPETTPDRFFGEVIMKIPGNLYFRGNRQEAFDLAAIIEKRVETNAERLAALANFYIAVENGAEAARIAQKAVEASPGSTAAYQALGMAHRLNFDLELASEAFAKAVEADAASIPARRGLADIDRALGRSEKAAVLYRTILSENPSDLGAQTGLVMSLFDAGKRSEADTELAAAIEKNPNNLPLLAGAAYWYAVNKEGTKAVELAQQAIALEPRYVWSHIALARGQMAEGKPVEAEKTLLGARKYGNFPTLDLEIATARLAAGFFRDAADQLAKNFVFENGEARTLLGGRISRSDPDLAELVASERRASILAPRGTEDRINSERLLALKRFLDEANTETPDTDRVETLAEAFVQGDDAMKIHRALFAASILLDKKIGIEKASQLVASATGNADLGLTVSNPSAAVMASELYEARSVATSRNEFLLVPEVPRTTLSAILRGRVEELAGWALYEMGDQDQAAIRFRRALGVLPEKSAWWRSTKWRLGNVLAAQEKETEALDQYTGSYDAEKPDIVKYLVIESLYRKLNGGIEGLEAKIGPNPLPRTESEATATQAATATPRPTPVSETTAPIEIKKVETEPAVETQKPPAENTSAVVQDQPKPEIVPEPQSPDQNKMESAATKEPAKIESSAPPDSKPEEKPMAEASEQKPREDASSEKKLNDTNLTVNAEQKTTSVPGSLFEPVVITIPSRNKPIKETIAVAEPPTSPSANEPAKSTPETTPVTEPETNEMSSAAKSDQVPTDTPNTDQPKPEPTPKTDVMDGSVRPRLVAGKEISGDVPPCTIELSQENVSLINNGGTIGVLVSIDNNMDIKSVRPVSSSPDDVQVTVEPEIAGISGRAFYIVRSASPKIGVYQVTFAAACGKKELLVQVR